MWNLENGTEDLSRARKETTHRKYMCGHGCVCGGVAGKRRWDELGNWDRHLHAAMCITDS